ncbi:hypothetical protein ED733_004822 [Metarhizium rileyi]|uniref:Uncharacterized protein n=1 Tax=Metarhizium rileyi (strain RCEF 4871) TaxID=1649241 RepID=A0A5C6GB63_METRR|nr:hypothetical protein ED733_004822 [Metarhizium rileyi]
MLSGDPHHDLMTPAQSIPVKVLRLRVHLVDWLATIWRLGKSALAAARRLIASSLRRREQNEEPLKRHSLVDAAPAILYSVDPLFCGKTAVELVIY